MEAVEASAVGALCLLGGVALLHLWFARHPDGVGSLRHTWGVLAAPVLVVWQAWVVLDFPETSLLAAYVGLALAPAVDVREGSAGRDR